MKSKILVISVSNKAKGGVASVVTTFMNNDFLNKEHDIEYFHSHNPSGWGNKYFSLLISAIYFPFLLLFKRFNVAHIHGSLKGSFQRKSYFLFWLRLFSIPTIYQCHAAQVDNFFYNLNSKQKSRVINTFKKYELCLCLGSSWVKEFERLTDRNWNVLFNPVPEIKLNKVQHDTCNFTFMGELSQRKGIKDLLNAFALSPCDNARLLIAGNGNIQEIHDLCSTLKIADKVEVLGWIDKEQKLELLSRTDVVVLPSYAEGLPMSILEAMSVGLPVITTPVGAVEDAITHNVHGLLVQPGNIEQISDALNELTHNIDKRIQFGKAAKGKFLECFKDDVVAKSLSNYYQKLIIRAEK
ncbi:glycosyltransferase family 4 protein [Pseudoalteromonas sp. APC 3355]|uniref:glycosyltransferase family 4 protein n=1 Tax=Pseudoalteromonas sp. APC 3355 TaxID=3035199 RepID=UPI0025B6086C|nr:glycosyltransferase family 4 protein [Pseudoalteromonas sp. APC 3355]MDN3473543.1 glycosyltransferase family 4 protein [Pseudoalteromonas sp. APC 3355]